MNNMRYNSETDMVEIYYNDVWQVWKFGEMQNVSLYYNGDENKVITGGWSSYAFGSGGTTTATTLSLSKESNAMTMSLSTGSTWYAGAVFVENTVDLTNYKSLEVVVSDMSYPNKDRGDIRFGVTTKKESGYSTVKDLSSYHGTLAKGTKTIDVSDLKGNHYIYFAIDAGGGSTTNSITIKSVRLIRN